MLEVINPFDQSVAFQVLSDDATSLSRKLGAAVDAQEAWRHVAVGERVRLVRLGLERFLANGEAIAREVTLQMGKPIRESRNEIGSFKERAEYLLSIAEATLAPDVLPAKEGFERRIEHAPLGVVLNLAAWNYPLIIPENVVIPALLAGNAVLLKHSAKTPRCGQHFEEAFSTNLPPGLLGTLVLSHAETAALVRDTRIAHVAFTGSVEGGRAVHRAAADRFIDVGLELGGKDPAFIAADADLELAVAGIVDGACYNAGQSCCAVERAYVHESVYDEVLTRASAALAALKMGNPLDEDSTLGPLASRPALEFLEAQVKDALGRGARLITGGQRVPDTSANLFPPTLLVDVPNDAEVMQEESFGPILPIAKVASDDEAVQLMNDSRFGLTASVWTRDAGRAERFGRDLNAGTIYQNRCDYLDPALPWTGWGDSGKGSTLSPHGFFHLTRRKAIHFRR